MFSKLLSYFYIGLNWVKLALKTLLADKLSAVLLIILLATNLFSWIGAYSLNRIIGTDLAVLHYNVVFGIDLVGDASRLYLIPLLGLGVLLVNFFLGAILKNNRDRVIATMLLSVALLVNIFCLLALYLSYIINFS